MKTQIKNARTPSLPTAALIASLSILAAGPATAATDTWNGGATPDGNWTNPGNWNGITPVTNDLLVFSGNTQTVTTNNYTVGTPFNNVLFGGGAGAFTLKGNGLTLSSPTDAGSGQITGGSIVNSSANIELITVPLVLASGNHTISSSAGVLKLNGSVTHSNGAVVSFSGPVNVTGALSTNGTANGILGGWAISSVTGDWATLDASSNVVAFSGYVDVNGGGTIANNPAANVRIPVRSATAVSTSSGTTAMNSLLFGSSTASGGTQVVNVGAGNKVVLGQNGGIYNSTSIAGAGTYRQLTFGASAAQGGILTAGDGANAAQITLASPPAPSGSPTFLVINSSIQDNGSAPVTVTLAGAYATWDAVTNTYSGGTYILQGRCSQPNEGTFGYGPVHIVSGGQANPGRSTTLGVLITNDFFIEGSGTVENQGMGALRMFGSGGITIGSVTTGTKLTGKITLTGNASVCANGDATGGVGISGKITGPGGFALGSTTFVAGNNNGAGGVFTVGDVGGLGIPNDYAGDTSINGSANAASVTGNNVGATLKIFTATDNNIMPHGATGSFAGGKTGNLILNATAANGGGNSSIFDLNGSTQTINGLISTAANPSHDIVMSSVTGGALVLGDNNATATFAGSLQDGAGLSLTKIGSGTETLSGANTYTGNTVVKAGTLIITTSSGQGNYSVSNNAALGVTVATSGSTLTMSSLTFGTSSTALQLNTGTSGNPAAPIVNVSGALIMNGNVNLSLSGISLTAGGPFTVMTYAAGSRTGTGNFVLNNSPRVVASLNDDKINGIVSVTIISADAAVRWKGTASSNWDINNAGNVDWQTVPSGNPAYYIEAGSGNDNVLFDDTLAGTPNVNLAATLTPQSVTVSNTSASYVFSGSGKITGATGLTKVGTGSLTVANTGNNDFNGPIALNAGTLIISNSSTIANTLTGSGSLVKNGAGTLTLSGDGSGFNGLVAIGGGTLKVLNTLSLATAASIGISNGATLDIGINSVGLGTENITVSGTGIGGNGAIVNSSGYSGGAVSTSFQTLTMTGDTTIGGPGRLDFRSTDANGGSDATLNTGSQPYNLTKVSGSVLQLGSVQIDPALANINVQGGTLGIQGNMPSLGNPASTINVAGGATLQFLNMQTTVNKALSLQDGGIVNNNGGTTVFGGLVTLQGTGLFNIGGNSLTFSNVISGTGSVSKVTGTAPLYLTASNTYTGNTVIGAGSLNLSEPGDIRNSRSITIGAGATLDVTARNDGMLTILGGHSLAGSGTLNGSLTNLPASLLTVGTANNTATFAVNNNVFLAGTNIMKVVETNMTADLLAASSITFGGTLQINLLSGYFKTGENFQLFSGGFSGSFSNIIPATPGFNLSWDTNALATTGVLSVTGPGPNITPTNLVASFVGANLTLSWPMDHTGWQLQAQTNNLATGLSGNWVNVPGTGTTNQVTIPARTGSGSVFYRMMLQ